MGSAEELKWQSLESVHWSWENVVLGAAASQRSYKESTTLWQEPDLREENELNGALRGGRYREVTPMQ